MWWSGTELNRRRLPFQGSALPAELPDQNFLRRFHVPAFVRLNNLFSNFGGRGENRTLASPVRTVCAPVITTRPRIRRAGITYENPHRSGSRALPPQSFWEPIPVGTLVAIEPLQIVLFPEVRKSANPKGSIQINPTPRPVGWCSLPRIRSHCGHRLPNLGGTGQNRTGDLFPAEEALSLAELQPHRNSSPARSTIVARPSLGSVRLPGKKLARFFFD